jgi:Ran-binding protein 9/10
MTTRPARSASIPIPRSSSAVSPSRNIESVITIPFATPGRLQANPQRHSGADDRRGVSASYGARGTSSSATATSPIRSTSRSMTTSHARGSPRTASIFEPRIVRATSDSSRSVDPACLPSSSTSPARTRRPSVANGRAASTHRHLSNNTASNPPPPPVSFARPAYLEHSALRHMLQTELPPTLPPSRKTDTATLEYHGYSAAMSPPTDSDEDSNVSPPRELASAPHPPLVSQDQIMRLPTRWSEQFRHALLTVSGDGRDLTYHGSSVLSFMPAIL